MTVARDHDVVGLQITMHNSSRMCFSETFRRVLQKSQQFSEWGSFLMDFLAQGLAINEFHRNVVRTGVFTNLENLCNVRMT